jgi:hypothetical protein
MKGKNLMIYGLGAASGFVGGSVFVLSKVLESEHMRQASVDILADKIEKALFGERHHRSNRNSKVSYRSYYDTHREFRRVDHCIFATYKEAEKVLDAMIKCVTDYGMITILDYYDLCNIEGHCSQVEDNDYGWLENDVANMQIVRYRDGYRIDLPRPIKLN